MFQAPFHDPRISALKYRTQPQAATMNRRYRVTKYKNSNSPVEHVSAFICIWLALLMGMQEVQCSNLGKETNSHG
jgi:hypothetical protein